MSSRVYYQKYFQGNWLFGQIDTQSVDDAILLAIDMVASGFCQPIKIIYETLYQDFDAKLIWHHNGRDALRKQLHELAALYGLPCNLYISPGSEDRRDEDRRDDAPAAMGDRPLAAL